MTHLPTIIALDVAFTGSSGFPCTFPRLCPQLIHPDVFLFFQITFGATCPVFPQLWHTSLPVLAPCLYRSFLENTAFSSRAVSSISSNVLPFLIRTFVCILSEDTPCKNIYSTTCLLMLLCLSVHRLRSLVKLPP